MTTCPVCGAILNAMVKGNSTKAIRHWAVGCLLSGIWYRKDWNNAVALYRAGFEAGKKAGLQRAAEIFDRHFGADRGAKEIREEIGP